MTDDFVPDKNDIVLEISINDTNDEPPVLSGFSAKLGRQYYIGVSDDAMYGSSVFQVLVSVANLPAHLRHLGNPFSHLRKIWLLPVKDYRLCGTGSPGAAQVFCFIWHPGNPSQLILLAF